MTKHSRNRTDRPYQTAQERAEAGFAKTHSEKLGTDMQLPFGYCCLSMKPAADPVASPYGHIFDKEFILNSLAKQKDELLLEKQKLQEQAAEAVARKRDREDADKLKKVSDFVGQEQGAEGDRLGAIKCGRAERSVYSHAKARELSFWQDPTTMTHHSQKSVGGSSVVGSSGGASSSSLFPGGGAASSSAAPPPTEEEVLAAVSLKKVGSTKCPITGKKLRFKDLVPIHWEVADEELIKQGGGRGM